MNLLTPCLRILAALMLCGAAACPQLTAHEPEPERTWQVNGESLDLLPRWPAAGATKPMDVTVEIWVKPDQASIDRERSIVWLFSNRGGADVAGLSVSLNQGVPHVNAFGSRLDAAEKLNANR
ncbi:MAG: hypothetical protein QF805_23965, partial [Pirellulaceae bacterium]|nr:hypothetical protein [Pirellulaceae bacterium]